MATTTVPAPGKIAKGTKLKDIQDEVFRSLKFAMADMDKAGDMLDHEFYSGNVTAYQNVLYWMEHPLTEDPWFNSKNIKLGRKLLDYVPAALVASLVVKQWRDGTEIRRKKDEESE